MARRETKLGAAAEARIAEGVQRGERAEDVAAALGGVVSLSTVGRRMRKLRGPLKAPRYNAKSATTRRRNKSATTTKVEPPLPTTPEEIPEGASLPELTRLYARCETALAQAEKAENLPLVGQMIRVAAQLSETIRKATPPKQADPNDAPDMIALRAEAARMWHEMIDLVADGIEGGEL